MWLDKACIKQDQTDEEKQAIRGWLAGMRLSHAHIGLSDEPTTAEGIAKYGSVAACRLAMAIAADNHGAADAALLPRARRKAEEEEDE